MLTLIRQELYKQIHGKFYMGWGIIVLAISLLSGYFYHNSAATSAINSSARMFGNGLSMTLVAMIVFASSLLTSDFSNNTIKYLFARQFSRGQILISKLIMAVLMFLYLVVIAFISTGIGNILFNENRKLQWNDMFSYLGGMAFYLFLMVSIVLLISNIFKSNAVAIAFGLVFYFVANIMNVFLGILMDKLELVKYNPLNFLNIMRQFSIPEYKQITQLSLTQMEIGTIIWGVIFLLITYLVYNHRNV
ncbi:MAG: ABC transporter permease [Apilactobacillus sp.]|uniref:ABC transporter permease n=1 Tax=Apilactobacillus TaxID=2767877 RepID=UPI0025EC9FD9|nr:ABC transporter permease [Apilactobacillus sp.]MCT6823090.1 ABC transporter permease [Apilactobacillus sp.]MCT6858291.1 ABC transporter permease [Apilactobacillus sp.]